MNRRVFTFLGICCWALLPGDCTAATFSVINLTSNDLIYSPLNDTIYASVPNSASTNPNSLTPINPHTAALGSPIAIGFNPQDVVISDDGANIYTVFGGRLGVQPLVVSSLALGTPFFITGGPQVKEIRSIPGRPDSVLVATYSPGFSPPATGTGVWQNGVHLPSVVGSGLGTGGPDIIAVDLLNGAHAYGYENSHTGYTNHSMKIDNNGVSGDGGPTLQNILTGFNVGHLELLGNRLFTNRGEVFNISPAFQSGAFIGGDNFLIDTGLNKLFSVTTSGSTQTLSAYDLTSMSLLGTDTVTGVPGSTGSLTRFGSSGLAFRTSSQVVILNSAIVPEPAAITLTITGFAMVVWNYRRRRD